MKILHLTLKKKWFDLILSGQKTSEYREYKPYWRKRLVDDCGHGKKFDVVRFRNGYSKNAPTMDVEFRKITFTSRDFCVPKNGEVLPDDVIVIHLGKVLKASGPAFYEGGARCWLK